MADYELIIVGAGPAGYVGAIRAGQLGIKTALISPKEALGGTCLNVGCIPSKSLLASSHLYEVISKESAAHGIHVQGLSFNFSEMQKRKEAIISQFRTGISGLLKKAGVDFFDGMARFTDPKTLLIEPLGKSLTADRIILATGSEPISIPSAPTDEKRILSSTGALALLAPPAHLAILGGGVIGLEMASIYARLGSRVTIFEGTDKLVPSFDPELSKAALAHFQKMGMEIHLSHKLLSASAGDASVKMEVEGPDGKKSFEADYLLVAVGRRPKTSGLDLEKAGVTLGPKGDVLVNGGFATNLSHIFAVGDLVSGPMLAHKASFEAITLVESFKGLATPINPLLIPSIMYSEPEMAEIGLTEEAARQKGLTPKVGRFSMSHQSRAVASGVAHGFMKVVIDSATHRLLGASLFGQAAGEMVHLIGLALAQNLTAEALLALPFGHPTLSEALMEAVGASIGRAIHA